MDGEKRRDEWMDDDTAHKSREGQEGAREHFELDVNLLITTHFWKGSSHVKKHLSVWYGSDHLNGHWR